MQYLLIENNDAVDHGGGIHCGGHSAPIIMNSIIKDNSSNWGGGVCGESANLKLKNVLITQNRATIYGGGVSLFGKTSPVIVNSTIVGNHTDGNGGGIKINLSGIPPIDSPSIKNTIVAYNTGNYGIYVASNTGTKPPTITYSGCWNNENGNFFNCGENVGKNVTVNANGDPCDLYYNIQMDPLFLDPNNGNYHLLQNSPCIDAGDPTSLVDPDGTIADMGAFYFHHRDINVPAKPQNLQATAGNRQITLTWSQNSESDLSHYTVYRSQTSGFTPLSGNSIAIVLKPNTTYIDHNVVNGQTYYYRISAVDDSDNESEFSAEVGATPNDVQAPSKPLNLQAQSGDGQITLSWSQNSESDLNHYRIYRSQKPNFVPTANEFLTVIYKPGTSYIDYAVSNGLTYYYRISAVDNSGNESEFSAEVGATPNDLQAPSKPLNLQAQSGDEQITLNWSQNSETDLSHYKIYRSQTQGFVPTANDSLSIVFKPNTSYVDKDVTNGQTYYYRISAVDGSGNESEFSAEVSATPIDLQIPAKPQNLQTISGDQQVTLTWSQNTEPDLSHYKIYRSQTQDFTPTANDSLAIVFKPATSYIDKTVTNGQTYYYRISAIDNSGNESDFSDEVSATPQAGVSAPDIWLSASSHNFGSVLVDSTKSWTLTIKNVGQKPLEIYYIDNDLPVFAPDIHTDTIQANDSLVVNLSFTPTNEAVYQDTFYISSNDPDEPEVLFFVSGEGIVLSKPSIFAADTQHDFGNVPIFTSCSWQLVIQNKGSANLNVKSLSCDNPVFVSSITQFMLAPAHQKVILVQFNPDNLQLEIGRLTIKSNDPDQPELSITLSGRGIDNQAPEILVQAPTQKIWINTETQIIAQVRDNWKVASVSLVYRKGLETAFRSQNMSLWQNQLYRATIPAAAITFEGLAYFVRATDEAGLTAISDTLSHKIHFPARSLTTNSSHGSYRPGYPRGRWHMLSIPAVLDESRVGSVLEDEAELGAYGEPNWRLFSYEDTDADGVTDGYQGYSSNASIFRFTVGKAFWLKANPEGQKIVIDVGAGYILPLESQTIILKPGWNQIGNPFAFPITFSPDNHNVVGQLYFPDGSGGYRLTNTMQPWAGYFAYVHGNNTVKLELSPTSGSHLQKPAFEDNGWAFQLGAYCGDCTDEINFFGVNAASSDGWDNLDYPEPPFIGKYISLYFPHHDWWEYCGHYTSDFRQNLNEGQIWDFNVTMNQSSKIRLRWEVLEDAPTELEITLYDRNRNQTIDMKQMNEYGYSKINQEIEPNFNIMVGNRNYINQQLDEIRSQFPESFKLSTNYPNPFNSTTTICFQLPHSKNIKLRIFNLMGQEVRRLVNEEMAPGYFQVVWDGKNDLGTEVAAAIYLCLFQAGKYVQSRKILFFK